VVALGIGCDFRQVTTDQCELVMAVEAADAAQALSGVAIIELTPQGITRVRRIRDHRALTDAHGDLREQTLLRVQWMNLEPVGHGRAFYRPNPFRMYAP